MPRAARYEELARLYSTYPVSYDLAVNSNSRSNSNLDALRLQDTEAMLARANARNHELMNKIAELESRLANDGATKRSVKAKGIVQCC